MYTSFATLFAAASIYGSVCSAAPTDSSSPSQGQLSTLVGHLDSNNKIDWTSPEGVDGKYAVIPANLIDEAKKNTSPNPARMLATRGPGADVGAWTNAGQIAGDAASYACEKSGAYGISSTIETLATDACSTFLKSLPAAPIAEKAWQTYQAASKPGADGNQVSTLFRWFYNSASAPPLTQTMCETAYDQLTTTFCQGKGDKGAATRGGEISVGTGDDYTMIGFDPNDA